MPASQEIASKADANLANALVQILPKLLQADTDTIEKATEEFRKLSDQEAFLPTLTQIMISNQTDVATRQLAAVLFRRRILKKWSKFPVEMQQLVRQASLEFLSDCDKALYKSLAEIVAGISEFELATDAGWPDLLEVISKATNNNNSYEDRMKGTELLKCVCIAASEPLQKNLSQLIDLFGFLLSSDDVSAGNSESGESVHRNVIDSIQPILHFMEEQHVPKARELLPRLVQVVDQLIAWEETAGVEGMALFTELCEIEVSNFVTLEAAKGMAEVCLKAAMNANFEEDTRASALNHIQMLIKYKRKAFMKFDLIQPLYQAMESLIVNDEDPDDGIMSGVDGDRSVYTSSLQVIDQMAMFVPAEQIINSAAGSISKLMAESNPNHQRAGLLILSVIVEGCADLIMANYMTELVPAICQHLTNGEATVRSAAYFALGQFSEHLQPDIADYADNVMPQLMNVVTAGPSSPEFQNRDVITKIYYALETFVESLGGRPGGVDKYLNDLMSNLVGSLVNGGDLSVHLLECIVGSIGAVATASEEKFTPFLDQTIDVLQAHFPTEDKLIAYETQLAKLEEEGGKLEEEDDKFQLWSRAISTLSYICRAVGGENFVKYAETTLKMAVTLCTHTDDSDIRSSAFSLFSALSAVMKDQMGPHMQTMIDILFAALEEEVLDFNGGNDNDRVAQMATMLEISKDGESVDDDEQELDMEALQNLNVETGPIEAKVTALETLCEIVENCVVPFGMYYESAYKHALEIASLEGSLHDEILRSSLTSALMFSSYLYKFGEESNSDEAKLKSLEFCKEIWPLALETIKETTERTVCMSVLYHLERSIGIVGEVIFKDQGVLQGVMETVLMVLSDKAACQIDDEGFGPDGDDQAEHDQLLIEYACDILPTTCSAVGGDAFRPVWSGFFPVLEKRAKNKKAGTTRAAALGAIADIMKASGKTLAVDHAEQLIPTYISCFNNKENNVRNNAIYGLGVVSSLGIATVSRQYPAILEQMWKLLAIEKSDTVRDQILGAVARMIIAANGDQNLNVPTDPMVQGLLAALPIKADPMELTPVVCALEAYVPKMSADHLNVVLKNIGQITVDYGKILEDETKLGITRIMQRIQKERSEALSILNGEEQAAVQNACLV